MKPFDNHSGASEVVGAMILIAVIGTVVSIAGVAILSQPQPEKIPSLATNITIVNRTILITHEGGDFLKKSEMVIMVDGFNRTNSFILMDGNDWSSWVIGDTLMYAVPLDQALPPGNIQIIYNNGVSAHVILTWGNGIAAAGTSTTTPVPTATPPPPVVTADFSGTPTSGYLPLAVQFTDLSTGPVNQWSWAFGDGNTSSVPSPLYTYPDAGNYTVILIVTNTSYNVTSTATKVNYTQVQSFAEFVNNESVFVYGTKLHFEGNTITGENATIIVMGPLSYTELDGGAKLNVTTIYVDGSVDLGTSNIALGFTGKPGNTYINGGLKSQSNLYGEINVAGNATLTGAKIHGNVSVNGNLTVDWWKPTYDTNSYIYYTGSLITPGGDNSRCIHKDTLPGFTIPDLPIPSPKTADWYAAKGYVSTVPLTSNMKIYSTGGYTSTVSGTASNVIIVAADGDITLYPGGSHVTGILFAPKGRVTLDRVNSFEGVVIARDGLYVLGGGNFVTFKNLEDYISNSADYPF